MNYILKYDNLLPHNIMFKKINTTSDNISLYSIYYNDENIVIHNLYIEIPPHYTSDIYNEQNKNIFKLLPIHSIPIEDNTFFNFIKSVENRIADIFNIKYDKEIVLSFYDSLTNNKAYIFKSFNYINIDNLLIHIDNVWSTDSHIGVNCNIIHNTSTEKLSSIIC